MIERSPDSRKIGRRESIKLLTGGAVAIAAAAAGVIAALRELFSSKPPEVKEEKVTPASLAREILNEANLERAKRGKGISGRVLMPTDEVSGFINELERLVNEGLDATKASEQLVFIVWSESPKRSAAVVWNLRSKNARPQSGRDPVKM